MLTQSSYTRGRAVLRGVLIAACFALLASITFVSINAAAARAEEGDTASTTEAANISPATEIEAVATTTEIVTEQAVVTDNSTTTAENLNSTSTAEEDTPITELVNGSNVEFQSIVQETTITKPTLTTEKADYHPGETAKILGNLFKPNQQIILKIFGSAGDGNIYVESIANVDVDGTGSFSHLYILDGIYRPYYEVTASSNEGLLLAQTYFRDSAVGTYDQCANDDGDGYATGDTGCRWTTGNIQANNSTYFEGDSTVQRLWLEGFAPNSQHTVKFQYGTTKAGKHAYDFLTSWNSSENWLTEADRCQDITGCASTVESPFPIPHDPNGSGQFELPGQNFVIRGGTITDISVPVVVSGSYAGDSDTEITVTFTTASSGNMCTTTKVQGQDITSCGIAIWFGAHIANSDDWNTFNGTTGAGSINGSPYHVALQAIDGDASGRRDNQMQAAAVVPEIPNPPQLTLVKTVTNDNGGTAAITDWTLTATGPTSISGTTGSVAVTNAVVQPGSYTLGENGGPSGYTAGTYSCIKNGADAVIGNSITLADEDAATCTINNNDIAPILHLRKVVVNDNGGSADASAWTLTANGAGSNDISGQTPVDSTGTLLADTFALSETGGPAGYSASSWVCVGGTQDGSNITVGIGQEATCTITNDDEQAYVRVIKNVINNSGGSSQPDDFALTLEGNPVLSGALTPVNPGTYTAGETDVSGYTFEGFSGDCDSNGDITVALGETKTCTITNNDIAPILHLRKVVVNDNGGSADASAWTLTANGAGSNDISGQTPVDSTGTLLADTFALSESGGPAGYSASSWVCVGGTQDGSNITVGIGQEATCTITNDDIQPKLTVIKVVQNLHGGTKVVSDFPLFVDATPVTSGDQNGFNTGTYTVSETGSTGYTSVISGDCAPDGSVTLAIGDVKSCTITNTDVPPQLTVIKIVDNGNTGAVTTADAFQMLVDGMNVSQNVATTTSIGSHTVSESGPSGYTTSFSGDCNGSGIVSLSLGDSKTCTVTNTAIAPTLAVVKTVVNDNGGTASAADFQGKIDSINVNWNASTTVTVGAHTASETTLAGYAAGSWGGDCAAGGTVSLGLGENKTCTITNDDIAPSLTLIKVVDNNFGGTAVETDWTLNASGPTPISGAGGAVSDATFDAGTYDLSESAGPSGYASSSWVCAGGSQAGNSVTLALGESATCTITNSDIRPELIVIKSVVNDNGGSASADDFTINVAGTNVSAPSFPGNELGTHVLLSAGAYDVTEPSHAGYAVSTSTDCAGSIGIGETKTCIVVNNDIAPTLTLVKQVVNDNGGDAVIASTTLRIDGIATASGAASTTSAGAHLATETGIPGYTASDWTGDCEADGSIMLSLAQNATCTIVNDDQPARVVLIKEVTNDNGGTAGADDFGLTVGGIATSSGAVSAVNANTDIVLNEAGLAGYSFVSITGDAKCPATLGGTVTLDEGELVTCTITNDDIQPQLIVIKHVINDDGGTSTASDFTMNVTAASPSSSSFAGSEAPGTTITLNAGAYSVSESGPAGYSATYSADCSSAAVIGQTKTCTVTNDDIAPTLTLVKSVVNDNGGQATVSTFPLFVDGISVTSGVAAIVDAGAHTASETNQTGYTAGEWGGDCATDGTVFLSPGQNKTCTITNDDQQAYIRVIKNVINNSGGSAQPDDFALTLEGNPVLSGVLTPVNPGTYTAGETNVSGYTFEGFSGDCDSNGDITVALGETKTCTLTNNDNQSYLIVDKTVVNDNGGTAVANDFLLTVDGSAASDGVAVPVTPGNHTAGETNLPGYTAGTWGGDCSSDGSVAVALGETKTCTITNDDIQPKLIVIKHVINDSGNDAAASDFTMLVTGSSPSVNNFPGNETGTEVLLNVGAYTVDEANHLGYEKTLSSDCSGTIAVGETKTCTITNDDKPMATRTQGYWQTHTAFTITTFAGGPWQIGGKVIDSHAKLFAAFYANIAKKSDGSKRSALDQARMQLLQQWVAAKLNCTAFGCSTTTNTLLTNASAAFAGTNISSIKSYASQLDAYNNSNDSLPIESQGKATPKLSQSTASHEINYWDNL